MAFSWILFFGYQDDARSTTHQKLAWDFIFTFNPTHYLQDENSKIFVLFYVLFVLCRSVCNVCVNVYCTTATGWLPNCS